MGHAEGMLVQHITSPAPENHSTCAAWTIFELNTEAPRGPAYAIFHNSASTRMLRGLKVDIVCFRALGFASVLPSSPMAVYNVFISRGALGDKIEAVL